MIKQCVERSDTIFHSACCLTACDYRFVCPLCVCRDEIVMNQARDMDAQRMREQAIAAATQREEMAAHEKQAEEQRLKIKKRKMRMEATEVALGERGNCTNCILNC
jgi:hypothetical protein